MRYYDQSDTYGTLGTKQKCGDIDKKFANFLLRRTYFRQTAVWQKIFISFTKKIKFFQLAYANLLDRPLLQCYYCGSQLRLIFFKRQRSLM